MRARLAELPRKADLALEGSIRELSTMVRESDGIIQPSVALWVDAKSGTVRNHALLSAPIASSEAIAIATEAFVEALAAPSVTSGGAPALAGRVAVDSPDLAAALRPLLEPLGVELEVTDQLPQLETAFTSLDSYLDEQAQPFAWELERSSLLPLYRAAAAFDRQMPWEYMGDYPPIAVSLGKDGPQGNVKTLYGCVLGAQETVFGIAFYYSRAGLERALEGGEELLRDDDITEALRDQLLVELRRQGVPIDALPAELLDEAVRELIAGTEAPQAPPPMENSLVVYFDPPEESDETYLAWIKERRLPLPASGDVPTFVRTTLQGEARLPVAREVAAMTLALEAVTGFLKQHHRRIERLAAAPFLPDDVLTSTVTVSGDRAIEIRWPGD